MNTTEDMATLAAKDPTPTWIQNEHGVKSCWPKYVAIKLVRKNYDLEYCEADEVPEKKQFPLGMGELTEAGLKRRTGATASQKAAEEMAPDDKESELEQLSKDDLKARAKRAGIDKYWMKGEKRLIKELTEKQA